VIKEDIVKSVAGRLLNIKAGDIMSRSVISIAKESSLSNAADIMFKNKISGMPVVENDGSIVGIITITDLFMAMGTIKYGASLEKGKNLCAEPIVSAIMIKDVMTITEDKNMDEIIDMMISRSMHTIPVVKDGKLIGVVGRRDVLRKFYSILGEVVS
jgi:CBS domain-containing protein